MRSAKEHREPKAASSQADDCNAAVHHTVSSVEFGKPMCRSFSAGWAPGVFLARCQFGDRGLRGAWPGSLGCTNLQGYLTTETGGSVHLPSQRAACSAFAPISIWVKGLIEKHLRSQAAWSTAKQSAGARRASATAARWGSGPINSGPGQLGFSGWCPGGPHSGASAPIVSDSPLDSTAFRPVLRLCWSSVHGCALTVRLQPAACNSGASPQAIKNNCRSRQV